MNFTKVDRLPDTIRRPYKNLEDELEKFMRMNCKYARVEFAGEYAGANSARAAIHKAIKAFDLPIEAKLINEELYLISTDM